MFDSLNTTFFNYFVYHLKMRFIQLLNIAIITALIKTIFVSPNHFSYFEFENHANNKLMKNMVDALNQFLF